MPASLNAWIAASSCTSTLTLPLCSVSMRSVHRALFFRKNICAAVLGLASFVAPVNSALVTAVIPACFPAFNASAKSASSFFRLVMVLWCTPNDVAICSSVSPILAMFSLCYQWVTPSIMTHTTLSREYNYRLFIDIYLGKTACQPTPAQ
jgi:hypothetical protein